MTAEDVREKWQHRTGDRYFAAFGDFQGNPELGYWKEWWAIGDMRPTRALAQRDGFRHQESDDFNIAVVRRGRVVALLWMDDDMAEEQGVLDALTEVQPA